MFQSSTVFPGLNTSQHVGEKAPFIEGDLPQKVAHLGIDAEFQARVDSQGVFSPAGQSLDLPSRTAESRALRWARDAAAKDIEARHSQDFKRHLHCHRVPSKLKDGSDRDHVQVRRSQLSNALYYAGLQTCGSPWACPHCSAKITERRADEIRQGLDAWLSAGQTVVMITLTNSHHAGDLLLNLIKGQAKALTWFFSHKSVKRALKAAGVVGHVRAWEITHGRLAYGNGWHPHFHILLFVDRLALLARDGCTDLAPGFLSGLLAPLPGLWRRACEQAGLGAPSAERGCKIEEDRGGGSSRSPETAAQRTARLKKLADYLAKMGFAPSDCPADFHPDLHRPPRRWGFDDELARSATKKAAKGKGETPFQFLDAFLNSGDSQSADLWLEYRRATKGRAQVQFSRGLRDLLGLDPGLSDEEISAEVREDDPIWAYLTLWQWRLVLKAGAQFQLLRAGEKGGLNAVLELLTRLDG